jgi:glycosyltransferase involved in cell wall biosynthesis
MKIVIATSFVPFVYGGLRFYVEWLEDKLKEAGHEVERYYLPFVDDPASILEQTAAFRLIDLTDAGDRLIAVRPPAHVIRHPHKILWFIHHIRAFYDLWNTPLLPPPTAELDAIRQALVRLDTTTINEAKKVFTNSQAVSNRLMKYNGIRSEPLYPPLPHPGRFRSGDYGDEIVFVSRVEPHKRQWLMIEAMKLVRSPVRLRLCGQASGEDYAARIRSDILKANLVDRVVFDNRWISEEEKIERLEPALAVAYVPLDEDGIGYPCFEAAYSRKAMLTCRDSGAVLEFVTHEKNGLVVEPTPEAMAQAMDRLFYDRALARRYGEANLARMSELLIDWDHVIRSITT